MGALSWQLSVLGSLLLTLWCLPSPSSSLDSEIFKQCLQNNSHPSHPISQAVYTPQNASYSTVLNSYIRNLRFTTQATPKPVVIVAAVHESHVQAAVFCGKKHSLQLKIRSGGHDYEGTSYVSSSPFFLLDMFNLRSIEIDVEEETAWVDAGATLGELFYKIAEKSRIHGFPAGVCPTVGVGGHFVGAGYGNMMRKYGLSVDNIIDARLVDVNGRILDRKSMGEDLFWAIRGGGASFGVLLAFKVKLVRVPETVTVFRVEKTLEQNATEIVYQWQHVAHKLERDLFIRLVLDVVKGDKGEKTVRASFIALFLGYCKRLVSTMDESFPELGFTESDCIETSWVKSILFWANISMDKPVEILLDRAPERVTSLKRKSDYVKEPIPKDGLEFIWKKMIELEAPLMAFNPYGGKMAEIAETETPFPHRSGNLWKIQYLANWNEADIETSNMYIESMRKLYSYMTPFVSKNPRQAFYNYKDLDLGSADWNRKDCGGGRDDYGIRYYMGNFERLVKIKSRVDGDNFFRHEQSIPTLSTSGGCCVVGDNSYADVINGGYAVVL